VALTEEERNALRPFHPNIDSYPRDRLEKLEKAAKELVEYRRAHNRQREESRRALEYYDRLQTSRKPLGRWQRRVLIWTLTPVYVVCAPLSIASLLIPWFTRLGLATELLLTMVGLSVFPIVGYLAFSTVTSLRRQ
jgi:hypothetical protein